MNIKVANNEIYKKILLLYKNGAMHVIVGSFLIKFISFFGSVFLVRMLSKEEFGVLNYYENFYSYASILAGFGLSLGLQRFIILLDSIQEKKDCLLRTIKVGSTWNVFLVIIVSLLLMCYPHPYKFEEYKYLSLVLILCIPFVFIFNSISSTLRALFDHKGYAYLSLFAAILSVVLRVIGCNFSGLFGTFSFRLLAEIVIAITGLIYAYRFFFKNIKSTELSKVFYKKLYRYSFEMMLIDGLWAIFMLNDIFVLGQVKGSGSLLADYKIACIIPANFSIIATAIGVFVGPYFTKFEKEQKWSLIKDNLIKLVSFSIVAFASVSIFFLIFAKELIVYLYGEQYINILPLMNILLIASVLNNGVRQIIANILSSIGWTRINLIVSCSGIFLQIILDFILISKYGINGLAYANVIIYVFMSFLLIVLTYRKIHRYCQ